jgi:hypothetical protein
MILIMLIISFLYLAYEKHCETKQIESISEIEGLTFDQLNELINKIKY